MVFVNFDLILRLRSNLLSHLNLTSNANRGIYTCAVLFKHIITEHLLNYYKVI